jgi:hypothetical protein
MRNHPRKLPRSGAPKTQPTPDQIRRSIARAAKQHQLTWHTELQLETPEWTHLLCLHLRLVELEHLEAGVQELL